MRRDPTKFLNRLADRVHTANMKWWTDIHTGELLDRNFGEMIALCHAELSEALEADRKNLWDIHLPHRKGVEVELVDCMIRILDMGGALQLDLAGAFEDKMEYNRKREDHKHEARLKDNGKKY